MAASYDQSGVPFYGAIAQRLADRLAVGPGERVAELGCGRGALTVLLADAVGSTGRVDAVDVSTQMVARTRELAGDVAQVSVVVGDAADPPLRTESYDVAAGSLVIFFLPEPVVALRRWRELVVDGGRAGVTTFARPEPSWAAMEGILEEEVAADTDAAALRGGGAGPFGSDEGVEGLFTEAGWGDVRTETDVLDVPFRDIDQWQAWVDGTALRGLWMQLTPEGRARATARVAALLDEEGGRVQVSVRHTLARR
jgi:SAM-dependent methyltransferase